MSAVVPIIASLLLVAIQSAFAQRPSNPTLNSRVKVIPDCGRESITVRLQFDSHYFANGRFTDWIIVGDSGRTECRLQGNGELQYIIQIAVFNDPCETKMLKAGEFQNSLRIAQFPGIILSDDLHFTFKCVYGHPEVAEFHLPQVSPSFDVNRNLITNELTTPLPPDFPDPNRSQANFDSDFTTQSDVDNLLELNGLSRDDINRSADISRASSNLLAILLSAFVIVGVLVFLLILYICLRQWNGRKRRHDQIHTDSATPSSSSPGIANQDEESSWWNAKAVQSGGYMFGSSFKSKNFDSRKKNLAPMAPYAAGSLNFEIERAVDVGMAQSAPNHELPFHDVFRNGNSSDEHSSGKIKSPQTYAEWREKVLRNKQILNPLQDPHLTLDRKLDSSDQLDVVSGCLTPVRSITEIYRSAETRLQKLIANQPEDNHSESSIEGEYSIPIQPLPLDKETRDQLVSCVNRIRGFGARKLTEQEIGRWKQLIINDSQLQTQIMQARNLNDLNEICHLSEYRLFFTRTKWLQIMECVNDLLTTLQQKRHETPDGNTSTLNTTSGQFQRSNW